jgi:hypothetical protein
MEVSQLSKDNGFVVGVVSSHGHESEHIQVWDVLPEVEAIHVCTIDGEADLDAIAALSPKTVCLKPRISANSSAFPAWTPWRCA